MRISSLVSPLSFNSHVFYVGKWEHYVFVFYIIYVRFTVLAGVAKALVVLLSLLLVSILSFYMQFCFARRFTYSFFSSYISFRSVPFRSFCSLVRSMRIFAWENYSAKNVTTEQKPNISTVYSSEHRNMHSEQNDINGTQDVCASECVCVCVCLAKKMERIFSFACKHTLQSS